MKRSVFLIVILCIFSVGFSSGSTLFDPVVLIDGGGFPIHLNAERIDQPLIVVNAPDSVIENSVIDDGSNIILISSPNSIIRNNTVLNANSYSIIVEFSDNIIIEQNVIRNGNSDGIIAYLCENVIIRSNTIDNVVKNGIYTDGMNMTITNNSISKVDGTGIYMLNSDNSEIHDNKLSEISWTPIAPDANTFETSTFEGNTLDDIELSRDMINPVEGIESEENETVINPMISFFGIVVLSMIVKIKTGKKLTRY